MRALGVVNDLISELALWRLRLVVDKKLPVVYDAKVTLLAAQEDFRRLLANIAFTLHSLAFRWIE